MSNLLTIRILPADDRFEWRSSAHAVTHDGNFNRLKSALSEMPLGRLKVHLIVPGEDVFITAISLNARNQQKLIQAIPYAVEEQLVGEVEAYHFALGNKLTDGRYLVAAVENAAIQRWLALLNQLQLDPTVVMPDTLCLPVSAETGYAWAEENRVLIRPDEAQAFAVASDEFEVVIELQPISQLRLAGTNTDLAQAAPSTIEAWPDAPNSLLSLSAHSTELNLRQGQYNQQISQSGSAIKVWCWAAVFAVFAVLLLSTSKFLDYRNLKQQLDHSQERSVVLLQQAFPDITRVVDARAQMEQRLSNMGQSRGQFDGGLLKLLGLAGPVIAQKPSIRIVAMNFRQSALLLELEAKSVSEVDGLSQQLSAIAGLNVELESASATETGASGRLRLRGEI